MYVLIVCNSVLCVESCVVVQNLDQNETVISFEKILFYEENVTLCTTYAWTQPRAASMSNNQCRVTCKQDVLSKEKLVGGLQVLHPCAIGSLFC